MAEKTMLDVIREICARGCTARVDLLSQRRDPHFWVMAIGPNGGMLSGVPAEPNDGFNRWSRQGIWSDIFYALNRIHRDVRIGLRRFDLHCPPRGSGRKRGAFNNALGRSRGGQTTK
jgi:hypothetical protein